MHRFLSPLCLAAFGMVAAAQPPDAADASAPDAAALSAPLTLPQALELAVLANPGLSAARHELQATEGALLQAGAHPNPALELSIEDTRSDSRESTLLFSQPLELGGKRAARLRAAEHGRGAAAAELQNARADLRANVTTAFFDLLAAQERLQLAQQAVGLAAQATAAASRRVAAGKISPVEESKARVAEAGVRLELVQAGAELASARRRLGAAWGEPAPRFSRADGEIQALPPLPDWAELAQRLAAAPALARAQAEVGQRDAQAELERRRRVPDLTLSVGVKHSAERGGNQAIVGVSMPLPLFDSNRGNVLESSRRADKARDELAAAATRLRTELADAHEQLRSSRQQALALHAEILPGADSAYQAAAKGFEFGKFGFLDVLDAQRVLLQTRSQYLRALSDAHRAAADIDRILGQQAPLPTR